MNEYQPLVSIVFLSYCQENYVEESLISILDQDYENVEIIVSDDASLDFTVEKIKTIISKYSGKKKITTVFRDVNVGLVRNFNEALSISNGEIIVLAAGDDISFSDRVTRAVAALKPSEVSMVSFCDISINGQGEEVYSSARHNGKTYKLSNLFAKGKMNVSGASRAFKRKVYDCFGNLDAACPTEDTPYILRALLLGNIVVLKEPGIKYRVHSASLSHHSSLYKMECSAICYQYMTDAKKAREIKLIDEVKFFDIVNWMSQYFAGRVAEKELYNSSNRLKLAMRYIFLKKDFSLSQKAKLFKRLLIFARH